MERLRGDEYSLESVTASVFWLRVL